MARFVKKGKTLTYTNGNVADIASGDPVIVGATIGIAEKKIAKNETGALTIEGVFQFVASAAVSQGAAAYLDTSTGKITGTSASGLKLIGYAMTAATASGDAVLVKLGNPITTVS